MRLSRFFGGGKADEPEPPEPPEPTRRRVGRHGAPDGDGDDFDGVPEGDSDVDPDLQWRDRAADVIPGGASTGSKRAAALYGDDGRGRADALHARVAAATSPTPAATTRRLHHGARRRRPRLRGRASHAARVQAAAAGHVAGLSHSREVDVAERLCDVIPCAEHVRFLKTGAEAVAAAVRIARAYTGRNSVVASGYFGWLDWANDALGVPPAAHADVDACSVRRRRRRSSAPCQQAGSELAAVVLEPVVERLPSRDWLERARAPVRRAAAPCSCSTRSRPASACAPAATRSTATFEPDLAAFGKAMANGFPLSAVVGRAADHGGRDQRRGSRRRSRAKPRRSRPSPACSSGTTRPTCATRSGAPARR